MRGHIFDIPKLRILLGIATTVTPVVFMAWSFALSPQPGETIPDATAATLRGGKCTTMKDTFTCVNNSSTKPCTGTTKCTAQTKTTYVFPQQRGTKAYEEENGNNLCCGSGTSDCISVWDNYQGCANEE